MAERAEQHGARVVVLQPGRIGDAHAALLHLVAELQVAITALLDDADHPERVELLDHQMILVHGRSPLPGKSIAGDWLNGIADTRCSLHDRIGKRASIPAGIRAIAFPPIGRLADTMRYHPQFTARAANEPVLEPR
ncbi:hypothetical protein D3C81_1647910 [compost metagenome]